MFEGTFMDSGSLLPGLLPHDRYPAHRPVQPLSHAAIRGKWTKRPLIGPDARDHCVV